MREEERERDDARDIPRAACPEKARHANKYTPSQDVQFSAPPYEVSNLERVAKKRNIQNSAVNKCIRFLRNLFPDYINFDNQLIF
jgi:hypothetical protein